MIIFHSGSIWLKIRQNIKFYLDPNSIKRKKLQILATFEEFPKTEHDLANSTLLDVNLQVPEIISFNLTGTYKEVKSGNIFYFSRQMLCSFDGAKWVNMFNF